MSAPTHMTHIGLLQAICNSKSIINILIKQYVVSKKLLSPRYHNATVKMWRFLPLCCRGNHILLCVLRGKIFHTILTPSHCVDFPYLVSLAGAEKITFSSTPLARWCIFPPLCFAGAKYRGGGCQAGGVERNIGVEKYRLKVGSQCPLRACE